MSSNNGSTITAEVDNRLDDLFNEESEQEQGGTLEKKGTIEVDRRLDDFFGEDSKKDGPVVLENKQTENPEKEPVAASGSGSGSDIPPEDSQLKDLKSVVLSLEWEITDQVMDRLGEEISKLEKKCKDDKIVVAFLQLLGSLGKYIQKKRAEAHPDSISLLNSVYDNLEQVMLSEGLNEAVKKKMLVGEVNKYKKLKEHIATAKAASKSKADERQTERMTAPPQEEETAPEDQYEPPATEETETAGREPVSPDMTGMVSNQDVVNALERINMTLKAEFKALREELKAWGERD